MRQGTESQLRAFDDGPPQKPAKIMRFQHESVLSARYIGNGAISRILDDDGNTSIIAKQSFIGGSFGFVFAWGVQAPFGSRPSENLYKRRLVNESL